MVLLRQRQQAPTTMDAASKQVAQGDEAYRQEQFGKAVEHYLEARDLMVLHHDSNSSSHLDRMRQARCLDRLVKVNWRLGEVEEALQYGKQSLAIKDAECPGSDTLARTLNDIGCLFCERGEFEKGYHLLQAAMDVRQATNGSPGSAYQNIATALHQMGRHKEARQYSQHAKTVKAQTCPQSLSMAHACIDAAAQAAIYKEARKHLDQARSLAVKHNPKQPPKSLLALVEHCDAQALMKQQQQQQGDDANNKSLKMALLHFEKAVRLEESVAGESLTLARFCANLSLAYAEAGLQEKARQAQSRSIAIRQQKAPFLLDQQVAKKR